MVALSHAGSLPDAARGDDVHPLADPQVRDGFRFWLGTHQPEWVGRTQSPLFLSAIRLRVRCPKGLRAVGEWALDSGGFTELNKCGRWTIAPEQYVAEVRQWQQKLGRLAWAAVQDWMCEPVVREKTGKTVAEHQRLTVENWLRLRELAPEVPWVPVLQGWERDDYHRHVELYAAAGTPLPQQPLVGLGSVCRRQHTQMVEGLVADLAAGGIRLHGFGFKLTGLAKCHRHLASADSLAWSFAARKRGALPGCTHRRCNNCLRWAELWRRRALQLVGQGDGCGDDGRLRQATTDDVASPAASAAFSR